MKKALTRALMAVAVLAASFGAFAGVSSANELDYSTNPDAPTVVDQVPQGFVPFGDPSVVPNDDDCTVTTTQNYSMTRLEGYDPGQKETFTYGYKEKTRESFELFQKQVRTKTEQHKFRSRTWIENKKETKSVQGYRFVDGGTTRVNGETIGGHWERVYGQGRDDFYLIPDVIINIVWGPGGVPDQYLGEGSVNLSSYGGPNVTVRYQASAQDFSGWSDWGPWSDAQDGAAPADTDTRDYESLPPAYGGWTNSGSPQQQKGADTDTEQWISAGTGYGNWSEWTEVTGLPERPERPRPDSPTYEWLELDPVSNNDGRDEIPGTDVTYYVATVVTEDVDCKVAALTPTVNPSEECGVEGTLTLTPVEGIQYLLDDEVVEGVLTGPLTGTLTAEALPGFVLTTPFEFPVNLSAALECVTPFTPEVVEAGECGVADTIAIPETEGVQYLLDGEVIEAGVLEGPLSGVITAEALEGFELDVEFRVEFDLAGAVDCPEETTTSTTTTTVKDATTTTAAPSTTTTVAKAQAPADELAFTGSSSTVGTLLGAALLLMGAAVLFFGRRKTTD